MIQRLQSIWLLCASLTLIVMIFMPLSYKDLNGVSMPVFYTRGYANCWDAGEFISIMIKPIYPLLFSNIAIAVICFANIFNFKRRTAQKRVTILSIIFILGFAFWCSIYLKQLPGGIDGARFGVGAYMPALAIIFLILAIFGINNDERLIRSAERLR